MHLQLMHFCHRLTNCARLATRRSSVRTWAARWSWRALAALRLSTGHRDLDRFITETVKLYPREIKTLLRASDLKLRQIGVDRASAARNRRVEVLGSVLLS